MAKSKHWQRIPTHLNLAQFTQLVLPHLVVGRRGPAPKLSLHAIFDYPCGCFTWAANGKNCRSQQVWTAARKFITAAFDFSLRGAIVSLDGVYDCRANRKAIFNRGMTPNIPPIRAPGKHPGVAASRCSIPPSSQSVSAPSSACLPGKINSGAYYCASNASVRGTMHSKPWPIR